MKYSWTWQVNSDKKNNQILLFEHNKCYVTLQNTAHDALPINTRQGWNDSDAGAVCSVTLGAAGVHLK